VQQLGKKVLASHVSGRDKRAIVCDAARSQSSARPGGTVGTAIADAEPKAASQPGRSYALSAFNLSCGLSAPT
jgi:hypothetical protein